MDVVNTWMTAVLVSCLAPASGAADETEIEVRTQTLLCELSCDDVCMRRQAATLLRRLGVSTQEVVQALMRALEDPDKAVRRNAVLALGHIGPKARTSISALKRGAAEERLCPCRVDHALKKIGPAKNPKESSRESTEGSREVPVGKEVPTKSRKPDGASR